MTKADRDAQVRAFLEQSDWRKATVRNLAGDASNRRYLRLHRDDGTSAVLMDAPPSKGEDTRPFIEIAEYLTHAGLAAPLILERDTDAGFLILEDLGDALFARHLEHQPDDEERLYIAAIEVLVALGDTPVPKTLLPYDADTMAPLAGLAATWYAGHTSVDDLAACMHIALTACPSAKPVVVLRDYHAENLLWLPNRSAPANVGLLDFQDARAGHPAYDVSSLLRDARRDVSPDVREAATQHFAQRTGWDLPEFQEALAVQGVQRNLRILGVFARLSLHFGKSHYVDLMPRVWDHLLDDLAHPTLSDVRSWVMGNLPPPSKAHLTDLKARAGSVPTL
ncbi:aminoglycoside phosphotransferase family protein [Shimia ponticola]|uniref:aminoglycoside phosphotransferase family protein n=1 Tax=Shimia ponticola TaxID=2582893 RepID=UPI0011BF8A94|nr:phosphotransferase [Shimia ponticola]